MIGSSILPLLALLILPALGAPVTGEENANVVTITKTIFARQAGCATPSASSASSVKPSASSVKPVASSASSMSGAAQSSAAPTASSAASSGGAPAGDLSTLLSLHNTFRAKYSANALTWNSNLASYAANYAANCKFAHSGGPYGENLAAGVGGGYNVTKAFNSWGDESAKYDYNNPGFSSATGHFTQVVWKNTTEVGCAVQKCADGTIFSNMQGQQSTYVICEYRAPGNVVGNNNQYFRDNVGTPKA